MPLPPLLAALLLLQPPAPLPRLPLPRPLPGAATAAINDNRTPAGARRGDTLVVELDVVESAWRPDGPADPEVRVLAFAERGKRPQVPAPLVRARAGTPVLVRLRSRVDTGLVVGGLRPGGGAPADTVHLVARGERELRYTLSAEGSHMYWAAFPGVRFVDREWLDSQLTGAVIVDPRGGSPPDRVLLITEWFLFHRDRPFESALVINGRGWPHTERMHLVEGDSVRWRVLNATAIRHPMHLHGFYYRVTARGAWDRDVPIPPAEQSLANTEIIEPARTMTLAFVPTQPGNWVFHCHFALHVASAGSLVGAPAHGTPANGAAANEHAAHGPAAPEAAGHDMRALVIGLHVAPRGGPRAAPTDPPRDIRLLVQTKPHGLVLGAAPAYGFVVQRDRAPARDSVALPGPPLELERGKPVRITVVNNLDEPTGVHWHGMEIESFPDGVPGWSGTPGRIMPPIAPRDSFVAEFTPPRAGTFLYHSHLHEERQIGSGMYGALLVVDRARDTTRDHVVIVGGGGPAQFAKLESHWALVNGRTNPAPLRLTAGETHRLRLISIHPDWSMSFALVNDSVTARWRPVAKDGADLPASLTAPRLARVQMGPGETADFELTPAEPGRWRLEIHSTDPGWRVPLDVIVEARPASGGR